MAREMALAGVSKEELNAPPPPPLTPKTPKEKWDNFWYHYKWPAIGVLLLLGLIGWYIVQQVTKNDPDYHVVVVTKDAILPDEAAALEDYLAAVGEDIDGDGRVEVKTENLCPSFDERLSPAVGHSDQQKLVTYFSSGERMLYIFDQPSYDGFYESVQGVVSENYEFFAPLSVQDDDYNAERHYWDWALDTRKADTLQTLPEHLYFGVRAASGTAGGDVAETASAQGRALLERLVASAITGTTDSRAEPVATLSEKERHWNALWERYGDGTLQAISPDAFYLCEYDGEIDGEGHAIFFVNHELELPTILETLQRLLPEHLYQNCMTAYESRGSENEDRVCLDADLYFYQHEKEVFDLLQAMADALDI
ncbi:MAG: hypothetical protein IJU16_05180 [Clostridia bacterium]|nr:hypothetical protein [Clostridia bacterium]